MAITIKSAGEGITESAVTAGNEFIANVNTTSNYTVEAIGTGSFELYTRSASGSKTEDFTDMVKLQAFSESFNYSTVNGGQSFIGVKVLSGSATISIIKGTNC